jgi:hypothetical protein
MAARFCASRKFGASDENGTARQRYETRKQLQKLHTSVAQLSKTHLKSHEGFLFQIVTFIGPTASWAEEAELPFQLEGHFPQPCRLAPPCFSRNY